LFVKGLALDRDRGGDLRNPTHFDKVIRTTVTGTNERKTMAGSTSETPVLDLLEGMTADSLAASDLDPETLMLVRIAALVAVDAPSVSYLLNIGAASEIGVDAEQVRGVLAAIAPIVGTARIASATGKIADALEVAIEIAEVEEQEQG
jgi:4-carboxymuconolactone decarboxylase